MASPSILSPCSSGRRSSASNSPEFEFWMVRNPSFPPPNLLSADELFVDGVLLPLHLLHHQSADPPDDDPHPQPSKSGSATPNPESTPHPEPESEPGKGPELRTLPPDSSAAPLTSSKRWKDAFKKGDRKNSSHRNNAKEDKEKKKERKGSGGASSAELNINIWPFSRSRSAGNGGNRPRMVAGPAEIRKVSSAPCSRSNSAGESKSKKLPNSPGRVGVHLGRSSPVWQLRRGSSGRRSFEPVLARGVEKDVQKDGNGSRRNRPPAGAGEGGAGTGTKARVLNLNVPMCIGYGQQSNCRSHEGSSRGGDGGGQRGGGSSSGDGGRGGNLFNLRNLFRKKGY